MAKLLTSYSSSPNFSFIDFVDVFDHSDLGVIKPDPTELFEELNLNNWPSIHADIQRLESDNASTCGIVGADNFHAAADCYGLDIKPEIRNIDCMWSSGGGFGLSSSGILSTSASSSIGDTAVATAVPLAAVSGNAQNISNNLKQQKGAAPPPPTVVVANNSKLQRQQQTTHQQQMELDIKPRIKLEPSDDYEQQLQQHSIPNSRTAPTQQQQQQQTQSMQHIPPGTSLLRKSNAQQHKKLVQQKKMSSPSTTTTSTTSASSSIQIPKMYTAEFLRDRDQLLTSTAATNATAATNMSVHTFNAPSTATAAAAATTASTSSYVRPDTPHSLDDDANIAANSSFSSTCSSSQLHDLAEFKHNVDLRACVMGSNNISLTTADPINFINHVSQELQDTSKNQIDLRLAPAGYNSLAEVLDVIAGNSTSLSSTLSSSLRISSDDCDSDAESSCSGSSSSLLDADLSSYAAASPVSSQGSSQSSHHLQQQQTPYLHSDHSYTRCKDGMDDLGPSLETPSDSDEEIDVVSIGDKKLPTNPSDKDRRALQTKVAYKFSNARIVKTANGVRTIPPRRRVSYELPYTPASSSPVKSVTNSRYPSPATTPYQNQYTSKYVQQQQQHMMTLLADGTTANGLGGDKTRKRVGGGGGNIINGIEYALPPSKKHRGKKAKHHGSSSLAGGSINTTIVAGAVHGSASANSATLKRHYSLDEAADTIEKRNLHNDMERQRRIGLKNLFEALKKQIPSIKDKERAPKVNILREAAKLCEALTREDHQLSEQKTQLKEQLRKRQELLARLRAQQRD